MFQQIEILRTEGIGYYKYIDLLSINGELKTFVMKKISDPNVFGIEEEVDGNRFDELLEKYKKLVDEEQT